MLIFTNVLLYILLTVPLFPNQLIFEKTAGIHIYIAGGEVWRLFTPIFIHLHFQHLLFNLFALFLFGTVLEPQVKKPTFLLIFLSSGVFANIITYIFAPPTYVHVGASGAIFGLLGAVTSLIALKKINGQEARVFLLTIVLAVVFSFLQPDVNLYAHCGGFLFGLLCGYWIASREILS